MLTAMLDRKYRGRRKGIPIREGSVRLARREAKLTLAQVAAHQVSRAAIHHIENGRVQPSLETLQLIARQTRKPLEFFLLAAGDAPALIEAESELRDLERLTLTRNFDDVIALGTPLLEKRWTQADAAMIHFYLGQAYCRMVRPDQALQHLPVARDWFERMGDEWMAVEALDWESSALGLMEDPEALPLAAAALERCRKLEPKPAQTEARILGHIANMYVVGQSWSQAVRFYQAAVEAAGDVKDLLQQAKMHHGLGMAYQRMLQPAKARQHLDKALALYSIESDLSAVYRIENDLGFLLLQEGHLDSAEGHLRRALTGSDELRIDRRGRGFILSNLGELSLCRGQMEQARDYLNQAVASGEATGERIVLAGAHALLGRVEEQQMNPRRADQEFRTAIGILEELGMPDRLRDIHMEYAELLNERLDISSAARHWKQAAELGKLAAVGLKWTDPVVTPGLSTSAGGEPGPAA